MAKKEIDIDKERDKANSEIDKLTIDLEKEKEDMAKIQLSIGTITSEIRTNEKRIEYLDELEQQGT